MKKLLALISFIAVFCGSLGAAEPLLVSNSPFGRSPAKEQNGIELEDAVNSVDGFILKGFFTCDGTTQFILQNLGTKKTLWLPRDQEQLSARILKWDSRQKCLSVSINGTPRTFELDNGKKLLDASGSYSFEQETITPARKLRRPRRQLQ